MPDALTAAAAVVMGLTKMNQSGWAYFATEIVAGQDDYWAEETPGRWIGKGAEVLGLSGEITDATALARLFAAGCDPTTGIPLGIPFPDPAERKVVAGFSLTFSPPKSVSVLWALAPEETSAVVAAAQDAAVATALEYLQTHAAFCRRGKAGLVQAQTTGLIGAAFTHRTSRLGDPQLHTHVLVANKVQAVSDGHWLSIDGRELYEVQKAAGMIYKAALRAELTRELRVDWTVVDRNGVAEIEDVPEEMISAFSRRRAEVVALTEDLAAQEGESGSDPARRAELAQRAAYATRRHKSGVHLPTRALRLGWASRAGELGLGYEAWAGRIRHPRYSRWREWDDLATDVFAHLGEGSATFGRAQMAEAVSVAIAREHPPSARAVLERVEQLTDKLMDHPEILSLAPPRVPSPQSVNLRVTGAEVAERHGAARYATAAILRAEAAILDAASARGVAVPRPGPNHVRIAVVAKGLDENQSSVVRRISASDRAVDVVAGPAGAGKSRMLAGLVAAYESAGLSVRGFGPSAMAADVLKAESGVASTTLAGGAKWGCEIEDGLVIVDEAGMARSDELARLIASAREGGNKVVLVGDPAQLGAVGPGGMFHLLAEEAGAIELEGLRRFAHPWEAKASLALRARRPWVIATYSAQGRISSGSREEIISAALEAWSANRGARRSVVISATDHATVDELANAIRALRVAAGEVEPAGIRIGAQRVGKGDEVVSLKNDRRLVSSTGRWVRNGERWVVTERHGSELELSCLSDGGRIVVSGDYVADHLALSYALTVHKAQGMTADAAVCVVSPAMTASALYVGMTRGREENRALVLTEPAEVDHQRIAPLMPEEVLIGVLRHDDPGVAAHELLRRSLRSPEMDAFAEVLGEARDHLLRHTGSDPARHIALVETWSDLPAAEAGLVQARTNLAAAESELEARRAVLAEAEAHRSLRAGLPGFLGQKARTELGDELREANKHFGAASWELHLATDRLSQAEVALNRARHGRAMLDEDLLPRQQQREAWLGAHGQERQWLEAFQAQVYGRLFARDPSMAEPGRLQDWQRVELEELAWKFEKHQKRQLEKHLGLDRDQGMELVLEL